MSESTQNELMSLLGDLFAVKAASGAEKMSIDDVLSYIKGKTSVNIDKSSFMTLIDLDRLKMVKDIDGSDVWFNKVHQTYRQGDGEEAITKLKTKASDMAKKALSELLRV